MRKISHLIDGEKVVGDSSWENVLNPATGQVTALVAMATKAVTSQAIESCQRQQLSWGNTPALRRARILFRFNELLRQEKESLARLISEEHGKVYSDALGEVTRGIEVVEFACGIPHLLKGEYSPSVGVGIDSYSLQQPVGISVGITPFNFPCMVPMWMFPVALACGNTFILKPSEKDPGCGLRLGELLLEAGLPAGVFNVVNGGKIAVDTLLTDTRVEAVSFVGSTPVAEYIYSTASAAGKRVQALGGAKNHLVVLPDADLDQTVSALIGSAFGAAGERCMAISVAVAVGDIGDKLVASLKPLVQGLRVGPGLDQEPENEMGPLITAEHRQKVIEYIASGVAKGAELVVDGRDITVENGVEGFFLGGSLFDKVTPKMEIYRDEIFGPVLVVVRVPDFKAALDLINSHEFGNGTAVFTRSGKMAQEFVQRVEVGMVGVNVPIPVPMAFHCFGGWKRSLFGPLHMHGPDGVRFFTRMKTVTTRWPQEAQGSEFAMPTL